MALGMVDDRCELLGVNGDAGGDEGRTTAADLQFTSEVRITTADVQTTPEAAPMSSDL